MNNEPVAWKTDGKEVMRLDNDDDTLHTHPVKELTDEEFDKIFANGKRLGVLETEDRFRKAMNLTDEEITELFNFYSENTYSHGRQLNYWMAFARAILRKAQEK